MKIEEIKNKLEKAIIALASVDNNRKPHNIAVGDVKVKEGKIIITDSFMKKTIENIKNNPNISLVFWDGDEGGRVDGKAEYYNSGKWLDFVKSLEENKNYPAKGVLIVNADSAEALL